MQRINALGFGGLLVLLTACPQVEADSGEGTGGSSPATSSGPTTSTGGAPVQSPQGLFECDLPLTCATTQHAAMLIGGECVAQLVLSGDKGVVLSTDSVGPYVWVTERLILYLGDGTALTQGRHYECQGDECTGGPYPWPAATEVKRCDVVLSPESTEACEMGTTGCWVSPSATVENCVSEPIPSCEDAAALLGD